MVPAARSVVHRKNSSAIAFFLRRGFFSDLTPAMARARKRRMTLRLLKNPEISLAIISIFP